MSETFKASRKYMLVDIEHIYSNEVGEHYINNIDEELLKMAKFYRVEMKVKLGKDYSYTEEKALFSIANFRGERFYLIGKVY